MVRTAIADLDTGVDAGHPDYDYLEPWTGEKTIYLLNSVGQPAEQGIYIFGHGHTSVEQSQEMVTQVLEGERCRKGCTISRTWNWRWCFYIRS